MILGILVVGSNFLLWPAQAQGPGDIFYERRAALIARFDTNGDLRLDAKERETMRLAERIKAKDDDGLPKEFLEKYDKDHDGEMSSEEWGVAWLTEVAIIIKKHDQDGDGKLNGAERKTVHAAIKAGKYKEVWMHIAGFAAREPEEEKKERRRRWRSPEYLEKSQKLLVFDLDSDGIASRAELEAIRDSRGPVVKFNTLKERTECLD